MHSPIQQVAEVINSEREACDDPDGQQLLTDLLQMLIDGYEIDSATAELNTTINDPLLSSLLTRARNRIVNEILRVPNFKHDRKLRLGGGPPPPSTP